MNHQSRVEWRERIEAVQAALWARADINDTTTHHFAHWANELSICLAEMPDSDLLDTLGEVSVAASELSEKCRVALVKAQHKQRAKSQ